ncbi:hypothetical protein PX699_02260 [Sphingobium sp. H39-3-25]|uniref:hypothetical protein n=1 Tax=Sphingobium arseniciresistens TaxID=3030834 RepID=UPI0023B9B0DB|nr:hypothetical protein [Sphingobium arseniciresistens]
MTPGQEPAQVEEWRTVTAVRRWGSSPIAAMFKCVPGAMPENAPGSLPKAAYAAVIAYLMREGGYPVVSGELPGRRSVA